jgi:hypothetical protein
LVKSIPRRQRLRLNAKSFNFISEMECAYAQHLQAQLLGATGLKAEVAKLLQTEHADLARRFTETVAVMCSLRNPGSVEMARSVVENVSVLDVFNLLREFPGEYFAAPNHKHIRFIRTALRPVFKGNRFHVNKKRAEVKKLIARFDSIYRELMHACKAYAKNHYGDSKSMRASITLRAAFENEPISLFRSQLYEDFEEAIRTYKLTGEADVLRAIVETKVSASLRRVDVLLAQGKSQHLADGGFALEMQTIDGINYSIRVRKDRRQTRSLLVDIPVVRFSNSFETGLPGWPRLTLSQIRSLRYRFTTNGWARSRFVCGRLVKDASGRLMIAFEVNSRLPLAGRLEGAFYPGGSAERHLGDQAAFNGYAFALPDKIEMAKLAEGMHSE